MKKILTLAVAVFLLFGAYARPAHAVAPAAPIVVGFAGATALQGVATLGSAAMFSVFIYLNTTGERPFENAFESVEYKYPHDTKPAKLEEVSYVTPESRQYTYEDAAGIHSPLRM